MTEFWNFHDTSIVAMHNWFWMLVSLGLGVVVGWMTTTPENAITKGKGS